MTCTPAAAPHTPIPGKMRRTRPRMAGCGASHTPPAVPSSSPQPSATPRPGDDIPLVRALPSSAGRRQGLPSGTGWPSDAHSLMWPSMCYHWLMADELDSEQGREPFLAGAGAGRPHDLLRSVPGSEGPGGSESVTTVLVAFGVNVAVAAAKSAAAVVTGSASLLAEAAHSWADAGNEIFLMIANRRSRRPPDLAHPFGHGREAYVWSLFAALGLFVAGATVSVANGIQELLKPEPAGHFVIGYIVLAVSFVLEGISFLQSLRAARTAAESWCAHQLTGAPSRTPPDQS